MIHDLTPGTAEYAVGDACHTQTAPHLFCSRLVRSCFLCGDLKVHAGLEPSSPAVSVPGESGADLTPRDPEAP